MLCIKNECMITLSIKIFHTFKKLKLAVNEKNYLPSLQQLEFFLQFNELLFKAVVLFCQGLACFSVLDTPCTLWTGGLMYVQVQMKYLKNYNHQFLKGQQLVAQHCLQWL